MAQNEAVVWKGYVESGLPPADNFILQALSRQEPKVGEVEVEVIYLSVDPYMRGRMRNAPGYFVGPFQPGKPLDGMGIAVVTKSSHPDYPVGTYVNAWLQWQKYQVLNPQQVSRLYKLSPDVMSELGNPPLSTFLGALGGTGMTAYCSLERIGKPKHGETVFVTGAAGAVGVIVGQLCKHVYGCRVVGAAGTDEKVAYIKAHCGYDEAFNYKTTPVQKALKELCPNGIDVYYDNVGGEALEAALDNCNLHARVVMCGSISQYNDKREDAYGVRNLFNVTTKRISMIGFIAGDFADMRQEFLTKMTQWIKEGKVHDVQHVEGGGLAHMGQAFIDLMRGKNLGKMVVQVGKDPYRA